MYEIGLGETGDGVIRSEDARPLERMTAEEVPTLIIDDDDT